MKYKNQLIKTLHSKCRTILTEIESKTILNEAGISVIPAEEADSLQEALKISNEIGYPVVLKINSPDITHKSDAGGVKLNIKNDADLEKAYREIINSCTGSYPDADIHGIAVQPMAGKATELIIGMNTDREFGPIIMFGFGGINTEIMKDVSFRKIPVYKSDAEEMIKEIKGYTLLLGYRGIPPVNIAIIIDILLKISDLVETNSVIKEIDLNPIFAYSDRALVADARIILDNQTNTEPKGI